MEHYGNVQGCNYARSALHLACHYRARSKPNISYRSRAVAAACDCVRGRSGLTQARSRTAGGQHFTRDIGVIMQRGVGVTIIL